LHACEDDPTPKVPGDYGGGDDDSGDGGATGGNFYGPDGDNAIKLDEGTYELAPGADSGGKKGGDNDDGDNDDGDPVPEPDDCSEGEGVNPFRVNDGNVSRHTREFRVGGDGPRGLVWARYHNTRVQHGAREALGGAGGWRHSYQYSLQEFVVREEMVPRLFLIQPSGLRRTFVQTAEGWHASEGSETIRATAVGYEVTLANGKRLDFGNKTADVDGGVSYQLQTLTTLSGDVTRLEYDSKGLLTKVADGFGHSLQLRYRESSYRKLVRVNLGVLKGTGSVFEFNVSLANQKNVFR